MTRKKILIYSLSISLLISVGICFFYFSNNETQNTISSIHNRKINENEPLLSTERSKVKQNKYYIVYTGSIGGTGSSFIPETLNPDFSISDGYDISISFDDNGDLINDGKIIMVKNYSLSEDNKEMIKEIAGDKYEEAMREIEERLKETKKNLS